MTERQQDQKWLEDSRAEYLRRTERNPAEVLREMAVEAGYDVDHGAVDKLAAQLAEPVQFALAA